MLVIVRLCDNKALTIHEVPYCGKLLISIDIFSSLILLLPYGIPLVTFEFECLYFFTTESLSRSHITEVIVCIIDG